MRKAGVVAKGQTTGCHDTRVVLFLNFFGKIWRTAGGAKTQENKAFQQFCPENDKASDPLPGEGLTPFADRS
jgi:hypothetical protein